MNLLRMHVPVNFWLPKHARRQTLGWFIINHLYLAHRTLLTCELNSSQTET